jgi:hypothetical protein
MSDTPNSGRRVLGKLGLKLLALLLGAMSWYLIQDAIRIESAQRKATLEPKPQKGATTSVLHLQNQPVLVLSRPGVWEWFLDPPVAASVWIEGTDVELKQLEIGTVRLFVDGSVITHPGEYAMLPVRVYLPADLRLKVETDPVLVRVAVKPALKGGP